MNSESPSATPLDPVEEAIFNAASELSDPQSRTAFLDRACGSQGALRARIDVLLHADVRASQFLAEDPLGLRPQPRARSIPAKALPEEPSGTMIGRYKLLQRIGEGGMGVVYMAEQREPVVRKVALKIIKLGMDTKSVVARFEAERQALALMDHPNIARVFDGAATDTGRPYFVMELVQGVPITEFCDKSRLPTPERLRLFITICQAVQSAHQKGIIHRDLKPSNVLVTLHDGVPVPKVIDFGVAKATNQRLTEKTLFTQYATMIGTPAYMSPEQAEMSGLDVDTRSDIYSLGVLLYELLTATTPFPENRLRSVGYGEMQRIIVQEDPDRPSTRLSTMERTARSAVAKNRAADETSLSKTLAGDLDWIVMKALEKDRTRRYDTANALASDVLRHLNSEPVVARPPSNLYRFQKMARRNKGLFAATAAIMLALVLGVIGSTWQAVRARRAEREQVRLRQQAQTEAAKSQQVAQFLKDMLQGVGPSVALGRDTKMLQDILDKTAQRAAKDLTHQPAVEAELRDTIGRVYVELGAYDKAEAMHRDALAIRRKLLGNEHLDIAESLHNLAVTLRLQGRLAEAETAARESLAINEKLRGKKDRQVAHSLSGLAAVLEQEHQLAEAECIYRQALDSLKTVSGEEDRDMATALHNLAIVLRQEGKLAEAETKLREALVIYQRVLAQEHPDLATCLSNLGEVLHDEVRLAEAETKLREALEMQKKLFGHDHPQIANSLSKLGNLLRDQDKPAEAETMLRQALEMEKNLLGQENPLFAASLFGLALVVADQGRVAEAETLFRRALAIKKKLKMPDSTLPAELTLTLLAQGKFTEAELVARECLAQREKKYSGQWKMFSAQAILGASLLGQKKYGEAEPLLLSSYDGLKRLEDQVPWLTFSSDRLVQLYQITGRPSEAAEIKKPEATGSGARPLRTLRERGYSHAVDGDFIDAAADFTKVIEINPEEPRSWRQLATVLVQNGQIEAYREHCRKSVDRFGKTTNASAALCIAVACLVLPSSGADINTVSEMADTALNAASSGSSLPAVQFAKGLAEYRQARLASAADWMQKVLSRPGENLYRDVQASMVLAMAQLQLKQTDEARSNLARGLGLARTELVNLENGFLGNGWADWIITQALLREAKALFERVQGPEKPPAAE